MGFQPLQQNVHMSVWSKNKVSQILLENNVSAKPTENILNYEK
jgi:hypothetical protein